MSFYMPDESAIVVERERNTGGKAKPNVWVSGVKKAIEDLENSIKDWNAYIEGDIHNPKGFKAKNWRPKSKANHKEFILSIKVKNQNIQLPIGKGKFSVPIYKDSVSATLNGWLDGFRQYAHAQTPDEIRALIAKDDFAMTVFNRCKDGAKPNVNDVDWIEDELRWQIPKKKED